MRVLALDISSKTGWALLEGEAGKANPVIVDRGLVELGAPIVAFGEYPSCYLLAAEAQAANLAQLSARFDPDMVVIEETNLGKSRYVQKFLEFLHCTTLRELRNVKQIPVYISSSNWRSALGLQMSKEDKKNNGKLSKAKRIAAQEGKKLDKAGLGIKGRIGKKHLSVRYVNAHFGLNLKMKDNDVADAICLGTAYLVGANLCDGE